MTLPDPSRVPGAEPLSAAQEAVEEAAAAVLIEMAFLVPRGTDLTATVGPKLEAYKAAIEARTALRAERIAVPASGEVRKPFRLDVSKEWCMRMAELEEGTTCQPPPSPPPLTPQQDVEALTAQVSTTLFGDGSGGLLTCKMLSIKEVERAVSAALARVPPAPQPVAATFRGETVSDEHVQVSPAPAAQARSAGRVKALAEQIAFALGSDGRVYGADIGSPRFDVLHAEAIILAALQRASETETP